MAVRTRKTGKGKSSQDVSVLESALASDPKFLEDHDKLTREEFFKSVQYLTDVRDGVVQDSQFDPKTGTIIDKPIIHDVRIKAVKVLNEMTLHKSIADKREVQKGKESSVGADHVAALRKIADRKKVERRNAEAQAMKEGKLARLGVV